MADLRISIAKDFSQYPAGRTRRDGPNSAERFREDILVPALKKAISGGLRVVVELDGVYGYSSSFLEETFGGLVRRRLFSPKDIMRTLVIEAKSPIYASVQIDANSYLRDELMHAA
jgi:hypothetical protein